MPNFTRVGSLVALTLVSAGLLALVVGGCPFGVTTSPSGADASTPTVETADAADAEGDASDSSEAEAADGEAPPTADTTSTDDGTNGPAGTGGLFVDTLAGAANTYFDVYSVPGNRSLRSYEASETWCYLPAGTYRLTQYFNGDFVYADDVAIEAGVGTTVALGAIQLVTVPNASDGYFDIYDATGATAYSTYNEANAAITAPAGTFVLKEYYNANFDYATSVTVTAGQTTTVAMGGIKLIIVPGATEGTYGIYDSSGTTAYATYNDPNVIITAPPGTFVLKEYFNPDFTYASNVQVTAGAVTEVRMGAIRYNGSMAYDIYSGGERVSSYNDAGAIITAPAGTYTLTKYYDANTVLATGVVVTAGTITDVP